MFQWLFGKPIVFEKRWLYKVVSYGVNDAMFHGETPSEDGILNHRVFNSRLDGEGEYGWEIVSVHLIKGGVTVIFKKERGTE